MMKIFRISLFFFLVPLLAVACLGDEPARNGNVPRRIVPLQEGDRHQMTDRAPGEFEGETGQQRPLISLTYNEHLVQLLTINLDTDESNEQILILKDTARDDGVLKLVVADYSRIQRRAVRSWETTLAATNERTVRIDVKDIVGDQSLQLILSGMNRDGAVTLDVFKQRPSSYYALSYFPICRIESGGSIEIAETEMAAGYSGGHRYGASFPIIAYRHNPNADSYANLIRDTYQYNRGTLRYELVKTETVETQRAGDPELATLFQSSSPDPFKNYIKGLWHKVDDEVENEEKIVSFNPETEEIVFYMKGAQEVYKWKYSRRSLYNTLNVYTENNLLKSIQPNVTISLHSVNELEVTVTEYSTMEQWLNEQWGGRYVRSADFNNNWDSGPAAPEKAAEPLLE
ncbi:MAG TPA: pallilysin-related adhesin, partial [Spirochaetia bacterium]|nr:pallilysin-related adhesin [Spirochaetia bacterium]